MFLRVELAIAFILGALGCLALAAVGIYVLARGHLSWRGQMAGVGWVLAFVLLAYASAWLALLLFRSKEKTRWRVAEAYLFLTLGMIAYGGSIPWATYLILSKYPYAWWILVVCVPFYVVFDVVRCKGLSRKTRCRAG